MERSVALNKLRKILGKDSPSSHDAKTDRPSKAERMDQ
jgi:hypothetical protein